LIARPGPQGEQAPLEAHDEQVRRTLSALLQRPWDTEARRLARESHFAATVWPLPTFRSKSPKFPFDVLPFARPNVSKFSREIYFQRHFGGHCVKILRNFRRNGWVTVM
jgi:hypothetical protein